MDNAFEVMVVGNVRLRREGIGTLLRTIPCIHGIQEIDFCGAPRLALQNHFDLVIIDCFFLNEVFRDEVRLVREFSMNARCLLVIQQFNYNTDPASLGVDEVLVSGFSSEDFFIVLNRLLAREDT